MRGASAASHVTGTKKGIIEYERVSRGGLLRRWKSPLLEYRRKEKEKIKKKLNTGGLQGRIKKKSRGYF